MKATEKYINVYLSAACFPLLSISAMLGCLDELLSWFLMAFKLKPVGFSVSSINFHGCFIHKLTFSSVFYSHTYFSFHVMSGNREVLLKGLSDILLLCSQHGSFMFSFGRCIASTAIMERKNPLSKLTK